MSQDSLPNSPASSRIPADASLAQCLQILEARHPESKIELGLTRVAAVYAKLGVQFACPVLMVAGTNGKGSTCAMLESILRQGGYRTGLYIKPHFLEFTERCRINAQQVDDETMRQAFLAVEAARGEVFLSYFEFTTLAILWILARAELDAVILEVGLGGRLDAVNVVDADVSIVTSIDIDHTAYLGDTRELIGFEKAGIFRAARTAICSDPQPPQSLIEHAQAIGADLWLFGRDFNYNGDKLQWNYAGRSLRRNSLAYPGLRGANQLFNACAALAALEALRTRLPLGAQDVRNGLAMVELAGRFQVLPGRPVVVLDVAHNPHAAATLAHSMDQMGFFRFTHAVFGAMADKDIAGIFKQMQGRVDYWHLTPLDYARAAGTQDLLAHLRQTGCAAPELSAAALPEQLPDSAVIRHENAVSAWRTACERAGENDRIVVFGSFLTVGAVMAARRSPPA
ncbi:bifunctional tetrahydrofolate synthase/dihydrofolate synthase [Massilia sp. W12]|uniref:bifunctional tetrahydrofolate synthase/dihydrofolate synthase n=1 Tax=Massilia sp. W12 TaxID=3126507 RepID=UPI0030D1AE1D